MNAAHPPKPARPLPTIIEARTLLRGQPELLITHQGELYRLRMTRNGKLILTK
ncbi:hemin uptake protein HemP [Chitinimonas lacunae]|uniref:Hemin uptake protein HemP n=1 Tax=Chitinimonas lacunae TaxID=1963018 RepID=A0ABV8MJH6_9NEIS